VSKEVIKYKRKDGVELSGTLYLPVGYDKTKRKNAFVDLGLPSRIQRQKNAEGRVRKTNEFTFPSYGSFVWVTKGYVVLDDAAFLYWRRNNRTNDNFITIS
jgi:hypothetical protein